MKCIALDFDNVIASTTQHMCLMINEKYNTSYKISDVNIWSFFQRVMEWSERQELDMFEKVWLDERLPPTQPNIGKIVKRIKEILDCRISIITIRTPDSVCDSVHWMKKHNVQYDEYIAIVTSKPKHEYEWDILVDDGVHNITSIPYPKFGILFNQPWNSNYPASLRINKLTELPNLIQYAKVF